MTTESSPRAVALAMLTLSAIGAGCSALLLHEYLAPEGGACGPGGGCDTVRSSAYSTVAGVPLPALGLVFFGLFALVLSSPSLRARRLPARLGAVAAVTGVVLLGLQGLVIGAWCPYCVVVDVCAVGLGIAALVPALSTSSPMFHGPSAVGFAAIGLALPMAIGVATRPVPPPVDPGQAVPESIAAAQLDDRATIVEFVDFECPFCRRQHLRLSEILQDYGERVRVVYRHMPLSMHPHAHEAARVACCAEEQGLGEAVADALMRSDDLSAEGCLQCARGVGVDPERLDRCLASELPQARLDADTKEAAAAHVRALPTCFIGEQRFEGLQSEATLREAIERALADALRST